MSRSLAEQRAAAQAFAAGDLARAERLFRQALSLEPDNPDLVYNLAVVCLQKGDLGQGTKLVAQVVAACGLIAAGVEAQFSDNRILTIPVTIIWVVGVTNAFNLIEAGGWVAFNVKETFLDNRETTEFSQSVRELVLINRASHSVL